MKNYTVISPSGGRYRAIYDKEEDVLVISNRYDEEFTFPFDLVEEGDLGRGWKVVVS